MKNQTHTLSQLAESIGAELRGDPECIIRGAASIANAKPGDICCLVNSQYQQYLSNNKASAVVLSEQFAKDCSQNALIMPHPELGFTKLLRILYPRPSPPQGIHPTAVIGKDCSIDPTVSIAAYSVIGDRVVIGAGTVLGATTVIGDGTRIGADCLIHSRVTLYHELVIGDRVVIDSGVVIGADGFGLTQDEQRHWVKIPQIGRVVIGDDVEVGANTTIDRGALDDTVIGKGVKLDNLVMIAHNVNVGNHTVMAGCSGCAGSTKIGSHCMIGGGARLNGHINVVDNVMVTGMGMVQRSIHKPGVYSSGTGLQSNREWHKSVIHFWRLDKIVKRLKRLERLQDE